ncbi:MAG TPA: DegV family protein [Lachnospiraceae bacterium]|nr:DegV family protein [Lachnospiraceae bacterium]
MVKIITDSASDLEINEQLENHIIVLPMTIQFGETAYRDKIDLSAEDFYHKLIESDTLPTTSQINPYAFEEVFAEITEQGDSAVVILISSELSGTYQSAVYAAKNYDTIYVVDSRTVSVGEQCLISLAVDLRAKGLDAGQIAAQLEDEKDHIIVLALLDTLEYLKKGGRISATAAFAGGLLSIKPVVTVSDGKVAVLGKARGSKNGNNMLMQEVRKNEGIDFTKPLFLGYSGLDHSLLDKYIEDSKSLWSGCTEKLPIIRIGSTIGTHVGPGAIALGFYKK